MVAGKHSSAVGQRAEKLCPPNLQKSERIADKKILSALFKNNRQVRTYCGSVAITIIWSKNWKIAILIKKGVGTAVRRNRIKRKIREAYRNTKPYTLTPFSIIFSVLTNPQDSDLNNLPNILLSTEIK